MSDSPFIIGHSLLDILRFVLLLFDPLRPLPIVMSLGQILKSADRPLFPRPPDDSTVKYSITFVDALARPAGFMGQSFGRGGDDATGAYAIFRSLQVLEPDAVESGEVF